MSIIDTLWEPCKEPSSDNPDTQALYDLDKAVRSDFREALRLIKWEIDPTHQTPGKFPKKALDIILEMNRRPSNLCISTDFNAGAVQEFYSNQRLIQLFNALKKKVKTPSDMLSEETVEIAINYGYGAIIPELIEIGAKIEDKHFVEAAHPIHNPEKAIAMMTKILPHVGNDVNVSGGRSNENAAWVAANHLNLEAFKWLEEREMKEAAVDNAVPSFAHAISFDSSLLADERPEAAKKFAKYLVDKGYDTNHPGTKKYGYETPTDRAFYTGKVDVGLVYIDAGAEIKPKYLLQTIEAINSEKVTLDAMSSLINKFHEQGMLTNSIVQEAVSKITSYSLWGNDYKNRMVLVAKTIQEKVPNLISNKDIGEIETPKPKKLAELNNN